MNEKRNGINKGAFLVYLPAIFLFSACAQEQDEDESADDLLEAGWEEVVAEAEGTDVRFHMWGGDEGTNTYIDEWVAPRLAEEYDIYLERVPLDTEEVVQRLYTEKQAGEGAGSTDVFWLNGENFRLAKEEELLWGAFAERLPNVEEYVDMEDPDVAYDFGTAVEGLQVPWGNVQFTLFYNDEHVTDPPATYEELLAWAKENPGRFTYPEPQDFTGNAFVRQLIYELTPDTEEVLTINDPNEAEERYGEEVWSYFQELSPHLWREGETYPSSLAELDQLFANEEVWMTMGYNEGRAEHLVQNETFPQATESQLFEQGSIGNTHYLSIPYNAQNKAGAMAAINFMLSPEAQIAKLDPAMWGESMVLEPASLSAEEQEEVEAIERGDTVPDEKELNETFEPEMDASFVDWVEQHWIDEVVRESS